MRLSSRIEALLSELGVNLDSYISTDYNIRGSAFCHNGDNPTAWTFNKETGSWCCWSHGCHEKYGKSCIGIIKSVNNCNYEEAVHYAEKFIKKFNVSDISLGSIKEILQEKSLKIKNSWKEHCEPIRTFNEDILDVLGSADSFAQQRGLDSQVFQKYKIGVAKRGPMGGRIVVPIRNVYGKIVGFTARKTAQNNPGAPKWLHWPGRNEKGSIKTSLHLLNIDNVTKYNTENNLSTCVLTEGPFDVIKMEMSGIKNSLCTFGAKISDAQIDILKNIGIKNVILAYDADMPGIRAAQRVSQKIEKNLLSVSIIQLADALSEAPRPGLDWASPDISTSFIQKIINNEIRRFL